MKPHQQAKHSSPVLFGGNAMKKTLFVVLTLMFACLTACSPSPSSTDVLADLGTLADPNGDIEATLEISSLGSSGVKAAMGDTATHEVGHFIYKGKPLKGLITEINFPSLWAKGSKVQIRGKLQNVKGVPVFVGVALASLAEQVDQGGIILLSADKTLPETTLQNQQVRAQVTLGYTSIEWVYVVQPRPELEEMVFFKSSTGVVGLGSPTQPTGLPKGKVVSGSTMTCESNVVKTIIGPVGESSCKWEGPDFDASKSIIAILIGL